MTPAPNDPDRPHRLIPSDQVEGTPVLRPNGDRIGTIKRVMIEKTSGKVSYAVMSFGGFLGLGQDYYPIPWPLLTYNERTGGYELDIPEDTLRNAPKQTGDVDYGVRDDMTQSAYTYYGMVPPGL
jgi:PRC-barrel domain protein